MITNYEHEGVSYDIDVPFDASQMKYSDFLDFKKMEQKFIKQHTIDPEGVEDMTDEDIKEFQKIEIDHESLNLHLVDALSYIIGGDISNMDFNSPNDDVEKLISEGYVLNIGDEITTIRLYAHVITIINQYEPETIDKGYKVEWFDVEYNKDQSKSKNVKCDYFVEPEAALRIMAGDKTYTNGEVISAIEYDRSANKEIDSVGDESGNIEFNLSLAQLAILLRREGERLPMRRKDRIRFIDRRKRIFENLTLDVVLNVRFFLSAIIQSYLIKRLTHSFLTESSAGQGTRKSETHKVGQSPSGEMSLVS